MDILRERLAEQKAAAAGLDWLEPKAFPGGTKPQQSPNPQQSFSQSSAAPLNSNFAMNGYLIKEELDRMKR